MAYDVGLFVDRITTETIPGHFNGGTDHNTGEEPGSVLDDCQVENPDEDEAVEDRAKHGQGEGWTVHPD